MSQEKAKIQNIYASLHALKDIENTLKWLENYEIDHKEVIIHALVEAQGDIKKELSVFMSGMKQEAQAEVQAEPEVQA